MSTILKALKKLEYDNDDFQAGGMPSGYMGPGSPHAQPPQGFKRFAGPLLRRGMLLVLVLSLGGTTFYFYRQSRVATPPSPIPAVAQKRPAIKSTSPSKPRESVQATPQAIELPPDFTSPDKSSAPKTEVAPESSPDSKMSPVVPTPGKPLDKVSPATKSRIASQPRPAPSQWQPLKDLTQPEKSVTTQPTSDVGAQVSSEDAFADTAPLKDGRLKIQAIAWSSVAEDRMAVINSRIVHEGDKVDGFLVMAIRNDDVIVRENATLYRVVFGRP